MKVAVAEDPQPDAPREKKYKANYRCIVPEGAGVKSDCDDFFLPWKELKAEEFVCPTCGSTKLVPLF